MQNKRKSVNNKKKRLHTFALSGEQLFVSTATGELSNPSKRQIYERITSIIIEEGVVPHVCHAEVF